MHLYSRNVVAAHSLIFMCSISVTPLQCASFVSPSHLNQSYQSIWTCGGFHPPTPVSVCWLQAFRAVIIHISPFHPCTPPGWLHAARIIPPHHVCLTSET